MTISHPADIDQVEIDKARLVASSFKSEDALLDTKPIPACTPSSAVRFLEKVEVADNGCFLWTAYIDPRGYGVFSLGGQGFRSHRVALAWSLAGIPAGLTAEHTCHSSDPDCPGGDDCLHRRCVRRDHLVAESQRDNVMAGKTPAADNAARDRCPKGHPLTGINLATGSLRQGARSCRICTVVYQCGYFTVLRSGATLDEARESGRRALAALTGLETPESAGLAPLQIHLESGLAEWNQIAFVLEVST